MEMKSFDRAAEIRGEILTLERQLTDFSHRLVIDSSPLRENTAIEEIVTDAINEAREGVARAVNHRIAILNSEFEGL